MHRIAAFALALGLAVGAATVFGSSASAQSAPASAVAGVAPDNKGVIVDPRWLRRPTAEEFARVYPRKALRADVGGAALIVCQVADDGHLTDCKVRYATPRGFGFDEAALAISRRFQMQPILADGRSTAGGTVRIPLKWVTATGKGAAPSTFPGSPSFLLTPKVGGDIGCPTRTEPDRKCERHRFSWSDTPDRAQVRSALDGLPVANATFMTCKVEAGGALSGCLPSANSSARHAAVMEGLSANYRAPPLTEDATPTVGGRVLMLFDWPEIFMDLGSSADEPAAPAQDGAGAVAPPELAPVFKTKGSAVSRRFPGVGLYYPEIAARQHMQGSALIECRLADGGALDACSVVIETPTGVSFGAAAVRMAAVRWVTAKLEPNSSIGVGDKVRVLVPFVIEGR